MGLSSPKTGVTGSNPVRCANLFNNLSRYANLHLLMGTLVLLRHKNQVDSRLGELC